MSIVKIENSKCLIVNDMHQDIRWFKRILKQETDFDYLIFNGDWFDTHRKDDQISSIKDVCEFIHRLINEFGDKFIMTVGNHDTPYYYAWYHYKKRYSSLETLPYPCSGFNNSKAKIIAKHLNEEVIKRAHLVLSVNGWLVSHAGVSPYLWPYSEEGEGSDEKSLNKLLEQSEGAWENFRFMTDTPFLYCGPGRGGYDRYSGVTWGDWDLEFYDGLPQPQLVGHTVGDEPRQKGGSWCIDCAQTTYAILHEGGELEIKKI